MPAHPIQPGTAAELHAAVDAYTRTLHTLVDVAVGAVEEAGAAGGAGADPRLGAAEDDASVALGALERLFAERLALMVDLGAPVWVDADEEEPAENLTAERFVLDFVVGVAPGASPEALDRVLEIVDAGGYDIVGRLEESGYVVPEFGATRGGLPEDLDQLTFDGDGSDTNGDDTNGSDTNGSDTNGGDTNGGDDAPGGPRGTR